MILAERGVALVFTSETDAFARRGLVHIAAETFPAPVRWSTTGARWARTLRLIRGDERVLAEGALDDARALGLRVMAPP